MGRKLGTMVMSYLKLRKSTVEGDRYTVKNPLKFFLKSNGVLRLSNGYEIAYNKGNKADIFKTISFALLQGIQFGNIEGQWKLDPANGFIETHQGIKFSLGHTELLDETFLYQIHFSGFNLKDKIVITAGAYIGDTPLFYSKYGAKVYGFEPDPNSYYIAQKNIDLNPEFSKNIIIKNCALGNDGEIEFPVNPKGSGSSSIYSIKSHKTVKVKSISISTILKDFNILDPYLLDLDIKGSEFDVIEDISVRRFQKVRIEYSPYLLNSRTKNLEYLIKKLKDYGYYKIRIFKHSAARFDLSNHGILEAEK